MRTLRPLLLSAALLTGAAQADENDLYAPGGSTLLDLGHYDSDWRYPDGAHAAHLGRYGVGFYEPTGDQDLTLELHGGYMTLDVDGEPASGPLDYTGRYLGLGLRYQSSDGDYLNWAGEFSYTWQDATTAGPPGQQSELVWYESWAAFGPVLRYGAWRFSLGAYWQHLDGNQTDSAGPQLDISAQRSLGGYLGLDFFTEPSFSLGVVVTGGARQGTRLVFRKYF